MVDRERLIRIIQEAVDGCTRHWAALIADNLIKHGVKLPHQEIKGHTSIDVLELSARAYNALKRSGINTVEELQALDNKQLARLRGIGPTIVCEILTKKGSSNEN